MNPGRRIWAAKYLCILAAMFFSPVAGIAQDKQPSVANLVVNTEDSTEKTDSLKLGYFVAAKIENFSLLAEESRKKNSKIIMYLDAMPIKGVYPVGWDSIRGILRYKMKYEDASKSTWEAFRQIPHPSLPVTISVGLENGYPIESSQSKVLVLYDESWVGLLVFIYLIILGIFVYFAKNSDILRDAGPAPPGKTKKSYSLGRVQMAWWFFIILFSVIFVSATTGLPPTVPGFALALMGIAGGTALGGAAVDVGKHGEAWTKYRDLLWEKQSLSQQLTGLQGNQSAQSQQSAYTINSRLQAVGQNIESLIPTLPASSNFVVDILSDAEGVSLPRFQMIVWTITLGIIFLVSVIQTKTIMTLDPTLLALMGISSGTYAGFKLPEKQS